MLAMTLSTIRQPIFPVPFSDEFHAMQVVILAELTASGKASDTLIRIYSPFLGLSVLAILRGLLSHPGKSSATGKRPVTNRKKRV